MRRKRKVVHLSLEYENFIAEYSEEVVYPLECRLESLQGIWSFFYDVYKPIQDACQIYPINES